MFSISSTFTSAIALKVSSAVITPIFLSTAALLIKKPSLLESFPLVGVLTTKSTSLFLTTSRIFGSASWSFLTCSTSIPASFNSLLVPSVATNLYPALANSFAIGKNSALSCLLIVASIFPFFFEGYILAATNPLYKASFTFLPTPKTSPVDFISGPKDTSTLGSFCVENTGTFTDTRSGSGYTSTPYPKSTNFSPNITFVAISTIGTPLTLLIYGTVLEALGLTSIT